MVAVACGMSTQVGLQGHANEIGAKQLWMLIHAHLQVCVGVDTLLRRLRLRSAGAGHGLRLRHLSLCTLQNRSPSSHMKIPV